jgi:hypothetical protein
MAWRTHQPAARTHACSCLWPALVLMASMPVTPAAAAAARSGPSRGTTTATKQLSKLLPYTHICGAFDNPELGIHIVSTQLPHAQTGEYYWTWPFFNSHTADCTPCPVNSCPANTGCNLHPILPWASFLRPASSYAIEKHGACVGMEEEWGGEGKERSTCSTRSHALYTFSTRSTAMYSPSSGKGGDRAARVVACV